MDEDFVAEGLAVLLKFVWAVLVNGLLLWLFLSFTCSIIKSLNKECDKKYGIEASFNLESDYFCPKN